MLNLIRLRKHQNGMKSHKINPPDTVHNKDIKLFIKHRLGKIREKPVFVSSQLHLKVMRKKNFLRAIAKLFALINLIFAVI